MICRRQSQTYGFLHDFYIFQFLYGTQNVTIKKKTRTFLSHTIFFIFLHPSHLDKNNNIYLNPLHQKPNVKTKIMRYILHPYTHSYMPNGGFKEHCIFSYAKHRVFGKHTSIIFYFLSDVKHKR